MLCCVWMCFFLILDFSNCASYCSAWQTAKGSECKDDGYYMQLSPFTYISLTHSLSLLLSLFFLFVLCTYVYSGPFERAAVHHLSSRFNREVNVNKEVGKKRWDREKRVCVRESERELGFLAQGRTIFMFPTTQRSLCGCECVQCVSDVNGQN